MREMHYDALQWQLLLVGIDPDGHRRAGTEAGEQVFVRTRPGAVAADRNGLIREIAMRARNDRLLELAVTRFGDQHALDRLHVGLRHHVEIALRPGRDHVTDVNSVSALA